LFQRERKDIQSARYAVTLEMFLSVAAQATLSGLVERLAREHPHHVVHTLLALKNGNRGRDGKVTSATVATDALQYNADLDKVAAAQEVLQRTSAHKGL